MNLKYDTFLLKNENFSIWYIKLYKKISPTLQLRNFRMLPVLSISRELMKDNFISKRLRWHLKYTVYQY